MVVVECVLLPREMQGKELREKGVYSVIKRINSSSQ